MWRRRRWARSRGPGRGAGGPPAGRRRVPDHVDLLLFLLRRLRPLRPRIGLKLLRHETARHRANWSSTGWAASSSATQSFVARLLHFQLRSPVGILVGQIFAMVPRSVLQTVYWDTLAHMHSEMESGKTSRMRMQNSEERVEKRQHSSERRTQQTKLNGALVVLKRTLSVPLLLYNGSGGGSAYIGVEITLAPLLLRAGTRRALVRLL